VNERWGNRPSTTRKTLWSTNRTHARPLRTDITPAQKRQALIQRGVEILQRPRRDCRVVRGGVKSTPLSQFPCRLRFIGSAAREPNAPDPGGSCIRCVCVCSSGRGRVRVCDHEIIVPGGGFRSVKCVEDRAVWWSDPQVRVVRVEMDGRPRGWICSRG
jgi:hypothetical protein